jgi:hypothetical protein
MAVMDSNGSATRGIRLFADDARIKRQVLKTCCLKQA